MCPIVMFVHLYMWYIPKNLVAQRQSYIGFSVNACFVQHKLTFKYSVAKRWGGMGMGMKMRTSTRSPAIWFTMWNSEPIISRVIYQRRILWRMRIGISMWRRFCGNADRVVFVVGGSCGWDGGGGDDDWEIWELHGGRSQHTLVSYH